MRLFLFLLLPPLSLFFLYLFLFLFLSLSLSFTLFSLLPRVEDERRYYETAFRSLISSSSTLDGVDLYVFGVLHVETIRQRNSAYVSIRFPCAGLRGWNLWGGEREGERTGPYWGEVSVGERASERV